MSPGTEFARDFCAGIGPLQLGVVLVIFFFMSTAGAYPIYFDMCGNVTQGYTNPAYVRENVIIDSYSRCIVVKATHHLLVSV